MPIRYAKPIVMTLTAAVLAGCATKSQNITAQYVSPMQYNSLNCSQVEAEMIRVSNQVRTVAGVQDKEASNDAVAMGVGMVLFWPALFFLAGDDKEQELAQLKGEHQALQQSAIQKECGFAEELEEAENDDSTSA
jgi:hypothetical protein